MRRSFGTWTLRDSECLHLSLRRLAPRRSSNGWSITLAGWTALAGWACGAASGVVIAGTSFHGAAHQHRAAQRTRACGVDAGFTWSESTCRCASSAVDNSRRRDRSAIRAGRRTGRDCRAAQARWSPIASAPGLGHALQAAHRKPSGLAADWMAADSMTCR